MRDALSKFCLGIIVEGDPHPFGIEGTKKKERRMFKHEFISWTGYKCAPQWLAICLMRDNVRVLWWCFRRHWYIRRLMLEYKRIREWANLKFLELKDNFTRGNLWREIKWTPCSITEILIYKMYIKIIQPGINCEVKLIFITHTHIYIYMKLFQILYSSF